MAEISKTTLLSLSNTYRDTDRSHSLVALSREAGVGLPRTVAFDGGSIRTDRVSMASSARFSTQVATLRRGALNAAEAASLLDTAESALARIGEKLADLGTIADTAVLAPVERPDGSTRPADALSSRERAILATAFDDTRAEIDRLVDRTTFNGLTLLKGDASDPDAPLEIGFTVGEPASVVTVRLESADVAGLSSSLVGASVLDTDRATAAQTGIVEAKATLSDIRAAVRGARQQIGSVETAAGEVSAVVENIREIKASPDVALDLSRAIANKVSREGGVSLIDGAQQILQKALLRASAVSTSAGAPPSGSDGIEEFGGKAAGAPAAPPAATGLGGFANSDDS